jgi:hypothetical protein
MIRKFLLLKIRKHKVCKLALQSELGVSYPTIIKYIDENNIALSCIPCLEIISHIFNMKGNDILETPTKIFE